MKRTRRFNELEAADNDAAMKYFRVALMLNHAEELGMSAAICEKLRQIVAAADTVLENTHAALDAEMEAMISAWEGGR